MCGIVAVVRRPTDRTPPSLSELATELRRASGHLADAFDGGAPAGPLAEAAAHIEAVDAALRGVAGVRALIDDPAGLAVLTRELTTQQEALVRLEARLDAEGAVDPDELETINAALVRAKDSGVGGRPGPHPRRSRGRGARGRHHRAGRDRRVHVGAGRAEPRSTGSRCGAGTPPACTSTCATTAWTSRARRTPPRCASASRDPLFRSGAVRSPDGALSFVYKAAAEIGELGDNVAALRRAITNDSLLHRALDNATARVMVLGHTRWASVGIISEANAHPLNHEEAGIANGDGAYVTAALNGDVDNFGELVALYDLAIPPEITTDAKVIPALVRRRIDAGETVMESFRRDRRRVRRLGRDRRARRGRPGPRDARAPGEWPGAVRRAGRRLLRRGERALRPGRGDLELPAPRR